jgi:AMP deaminase
MLAKTEHVRTAQMWKMTTTDLCELARNGVLHSGFPHECKKHWLCTTYWKPGPHGNDIQKTNVPNLRMRFRYETHQEEMRLMYLGTMEHVRQGNNNLRLD